MDKCFGSKSWELDFFRDKWGQRRWTLAFSVKGGHVQLAVFSPWIRIYFGYNRKPLVRIFDVQNWLKYRRDYSEFYKSTHGFGFDILERKKWLEREIPALSQELKGLA